MGTTKAHIFSSSQNELAKITKVLGHPARIAILEQLLKQRSCNCKALVHETGLAQATISQHLKALKSLDIIASRTEGKSTLYQVNLHKWHEIKIRISDFFINFSSKN